MSFILWPEYSTVCVYRRCFSTVAAQHHKTSQTENVNDNIEQGVPCEHGNEHVRSGILWDGFIFFFFISPDSMYHNWRWDIHWIKSFTVYGERRQSKWLGKTKVFDSSAGLCRGHATFSSASLTMYDAFFSTSSIICICLIPTTRTSMWCLGGGGLRLIFLWSTSVYLTWLRYRYWLSLPFEFRWAVAGGS